MPLWIDNTGLHSAGRALAGHALGHVDVEGLLQFATLLVFGDSLLVNRFEPSAVARRTAEIRDQLIDLGVGSNVLQVADCAENVYWSACVRAAETCSEQLRWTFVASSAGAAGTQPDMPREDHYDQMEFLRMAQGELRVPDVATIRADSEGRRASWALHYMLATTPEFGRAIIDTVRSTPMWSTDHTAQLDTCVRFFLNDALATLANAVYTPAVARARTVRVYHHNFVANFLSSLDATLAPLTIQPLGMPAVANVLLKRSKGSRAGLLTEALAMRQDARPLREWLANMGSIASATTPEAYIDARRAIQQLISDAVSALRLTPSGDGVDVSLTLGVPTLNASPHSVSTAIRRLFHRKQIAVLTEISKYVLYPDATEAYFMRLAHECGVR